MHRPDPQNNELTLSEPREPIETSPGVVRPLHERGSVRFGTTLVANILRGGLSFLTGLLIARFLGVSRYGDLNFLLGSFAAMNVLLDAGSTPAFYTFISERKRPPVFFAFYLSWTLGVQFLGSILILTLVPHRAMSAIWLGQSRADVLLAFCASFAVSQLWMFVTQLGEAARKTAVVQTISVTQAVLHLVLIAAFWKVNLLSLRTVLLLQFAELVVIAAVVTPRILRLNLREDDGTTLMDVVRAFIEYCKPLVLLSGLTFAYVFADRWLLQRFGGAQQQGFFSIGQQFSIIGLLATNAVLNVFWKEVAEARELNNVERLRMLYRLVRRAVFFVGAWTAALLIPYSREILIFTVGAGYSGAWLPLALMFLFSVHQSLGQLQGTFFKAMGETRPYTIIGSTRLVISIPITYLILAPATATIPGAGLGGIGLALKLVLLQFLGVTVEAIWLIRRFHVAPDFGFQAVILSGVIAASYTAKWVTTSFAHLFVLSPSPLAAFLSGALFFTAITVAILVGLRRRLGFLQAILEGLISAVKLRGRMDPA